MKNNSLEGKVIDTEQEGIQPDKIFTDEQVQQMTLLDKLEHLIMLTLDCQLTDEFFKRHECLIQSAANDLHLTPSQTVMLCPFVNNPAMDWGFEALQEYFMCSAITIMKHSEDLNVLRKRQYICGQSSSRFVKSYVNHLSAKAHHLLCRNQGMPIVKTTNLTPNEFMKLFNDISNEYDSIMSVENEDLILEMLKLMSDNPELKIVKAIDNLNVCCEDKFIMLTFCKHLVIDQDESLPIEFFRGICDCFMEFRETMLEGSHFFVQNGLLVPSYDEGFSQRNLFSLTKKARKMFLKEYKIPKGVTEGLDIANIKLIHPKDIKHKELFYSEEEQQQIDTLQSLLCDKQLMSIRKRLEAANMRKGFSCLFYGAPGTGKTETVMQLARQTGRDIVQVDISSIREKWYGETEKAVQSIFDDYASLLRQSKRIPILLINEADSLLSKRMDLSKNNQSITKTENAIQNILLQAMENFDGILIATTNLTCNLDSAFDRRFLYKVEFLQPTVEVKTKIWKVFLPDINESQAVELANAYDFSGGQIENVARKVLVDHLLFGNTPDMEHIKTICTNEKLAGIADYSPIGFRVQKIA